MSEKAAGALGGAAAGAQMGAAFGPWGMAAGAVIGGVAGLLGGGEDDAAREAAQEQERAAAIASDKTRVAQEIEADQLARQQVLFQQYDALAEQAMAEAQRQARQDTLAVDGGLDGSLTAAAVARRRAGFYS